MSRHKKSVLVFFLLSTLGIGLLPVINSIKQPKELDFKSLYNTDVVEGQINYWLYKFFAKSTDPNNVIAGKQGSLFLGNNHNKLIYKTIGEYPYSDNQIKNWSTNLLSLQQWYESQGIGFLMVLVPNKHSIYPEELPNWVKPTAHSLTDELIEVSKQANINLLDLRPVLLESKTQYSERVYWKTDSHWNQLGAAVSFEAVIERINEIYQLDLQTPAFSNKSQAVRLDGGTAGFLKMQRLLPIGFENAVSVSIKDESEVCLGSIDPLTLMAEPCAMSFRPYINVHRGPVYVVNNEALNSNKVLMLVDSFYGLGSNLYNKTFQTSWVYRYNHILDEDLARFIDLHQPNMVVYQVVERAFFNNQFISIQSDKSD